MFRDDVVADLDAIFFDDDFADAVEYKQDGNTYSVRIIIGEQKMDEDNSIEMESQTVIFIRQSELDAYGIEPKPHDIIDGKWEVSDRFLNMGIWQLSCYSDVRSRM